MGLRPQPARAPECGDEAGGREQRSETSGLELSSSGQQIKPLRSGAEGPAKLITTKGYSTTVALSVMKHLLMQGQLRRGDGLYQIPGSRRKERLMLHGRTSKNANNASTGVKHEKLMAVPSDYCPESDTCVKAFVRLCAARASALLASERNSDE